MNPSLFTRVLPLLLVCGGFAQAQMGAPPPPDNTGGEVDPAKLVEAIAKDPEIYHQSCMREERPKQLSVVVSFAGRSSSSQYEVSAKQFQQLRDNRDGAIQALNAWLKAAGDSVNASDSAGSNPLRSKMCMLVDLNAVSSLPLLKKRVEAYLKSWKDAGSITEVDWSKYYKLPEKERNALEAKVATVDDMGDMLSAIVAILRQEKFEPAVNSKLEKDGEAEMAKIEADSWGKEAAEKVKKNGGKIPEADRASILADPVTGNYRTIWYPKLNVTQEQITEILGWVDAYEKLPADKKLDEKGMLAYPVDR